MEAPSPATALNCTQCGGELHPDEGQVFLTCPYCAAAVYLDKARVVLHAHLAPTFDEAQARAALARWMSGSSTVKDLDQKSRVVSAAFEYFPLWYFKSKLPNGPEQVNLQPAAATSVSELRLLPLPAGDLRKYDPNLQAQSTQPTVPLEAARAWLAQARPNAAVTESTLVHVPIYTFKYEYRGQVYTAVVEAATGRVLANLFPAKAEAPYLLAAGVTALVYLCLAVIALASSDLAGIVFLIGLAAAPFLFGLAVWVASKV